MNDSKMEFKRHIEEADKWLSNMLEKNEKLNSLNKNSADWDSFLKNISETFADTYGLLLNKRHNEMDFKEWESLIEDLKDGRLKSNSNNIYSLINKDSHNTVIGLKRLQSLGEKQLNNLKDEDLTYIALSISISSALEKHGINDLEYPLILKNNILGLSREDVLSKESKQENINKLRMK